MSHEVEANSYLGMVVVTLWGAVSVEERAHALDKALRHLDGETCHRVLIDFIGGHATEDSFQASSDFARRLASEPKLRDCRIAYVYPPNAKVNNAVEALARARQLRFRKFDCVAGALDWLLATPRCSPVAKSRLAA
jgi:hypothetical protein